MIPTTDQWKLTGKCEECRRRTYCHSLCKKRTQRLAAEQLLGTDAPLFKFQNENFGFEKKKE